MSNTEQITEALRDMLEGWKYIRSTHGDLFGVGWDRAQSKAEAALSAQSAVQEPVLKGWEIELKANGDWHIVSPSGDSAHVFHDDESPLGEVSRQLMQSIAFGVNCARPSTHPSSAAHVEEIRNVALEEAAQLNERWSEARKPRFGGLALVNAATAIRALKTPAPSKGEGS